MNTFLNGLKEADNYKLTENGGVAYKSTLNKVYDLFAFGGAYRNRSDEDCIDLFEKAYLTDELLALKCLFYLADCRGGQGERRFFRVCFRWLAQNYPEVAARNLKLIPIYRRWDDVIYSCVGTKVGDKALAFIKDQFDLDQNSTTPSLLGKWLPSENASSAKTIAMGNIVRSYFGMTHKQYRQALTQLRTRINIVEKLMSENRWNEIEFDKIPSRAGLIYKNAFAKHDVEKRYAEFMADENTVVNAGVLYPYEVVSQAVHHISSGWRKCEIDIDEVDRNAINKYWDNLPDYFNGKQSNMLCVVDTSGSMTGSQASAPINVAISLGMYCAERAGGPFANHYISFSNRPQLIEVYGKDFVEKVYNIYKTNLCENTDLTAVFDMLLEVAQRPTTNPADIPETIVVISDMEIDCMSYWHENEVLTEMEKVRKIWAQAGYKLPRLVYWNVDARSNTILDKGSDVSFISGMSPTIFESVITGKSGIDLMLDKLQSERYAAVK